MVKKCAYNTSGKDVRKYLAFVKQQKDLAINNQSNELGGDESENYCGCSFQ
jgi:predicted transcriptional regulator